MCQISQSTLTESQSPTTPDHSFEKWIERFKISWADALTWELVAYKTVKALRGKKEETRLYFSRFLSYCSASRNEKNSKDSPEHNKTLLC